MTGQIDKCHCSEALNVFQSKLLPYMSSTPCINLINLPRLMDTLFNPHVACIHTAGSGVTSPHGVQHDLGRDTRPHGFSGRRCRTRNAHVSPRSLLAAQPWDQATFFAPGVGTFLGGDLLFPQPALDSLELVGRHPVPGREITCRHTLLVSLQSPGRVILTKHPLLLSTYLFTYQP